ncbi:transcription factor 21 [Cololabis saira]|uniref:transcription factor 21 n=1 Tax=Cololabis saira TaxID=129043 RepID=UPI002AD3FECC|nr:transcription factor 21 [Cololabis saira]
MSTGSAASDAEDDETCHRRTTIKTTSSSSSSSCKNTSRKSARFHRCSTDEERGEDGAEGRTEPELGRLSRTHQEEPRHTQRHAANARERARMRVLSKAFSRLKTTLPWVPADTKLSKLDTLRLASSYISHLRQLLEDDRFESRFAHPVNLTWPFLMSGRSEEDISSPIRLCGATA